MRVMLDVNRMLPTVDFNNQPGRSRDEVAEIWRDLYLPVEADAANFPGTKRPPENGFRFCRVVSEMSGAVRVFHRL